MNKNAPWRRVGLLLLSICFTSMLVACATTSPALSESQELLAQGKLDEAGSP